MIRGIFVTGTDTNVGKTVVSAAVMLRYRGEAPLKYWKPVQTGIEHDDDAREVARLAGMPAIHDRGVRLPHPVSPHLAARLAGARITVQSLLEHVNGEAGTRWIVEGAGGVLVPINELETMADLICALDLPVLIAARSSLGTINHTLMTIETLRRRMLRVAGVVMVGEPNDENRLAIEKYGAAEVIAEMPRFDPLTPEALEGWATTAFDRSGVLFVGGLR
ncbi:MAG TPA: dethiobiotin synthase [Vicinamibacterales bacterium]